MIKIKIRHWAVELKKNADSISRELGKFFSIGKLSFVKVFKALSYEINLYQESRSL